MLASIIRYFKPSYLSKVEKIQAQLEQQRTNIENLNSVIDHRTDQVHHLEQTLQANADAEEAKYKSIEPWVEIKSERIDPIKGLVIELDWNDAFVQYLKDNGISGRDDDTIVQKWVAMLYQNLMHEMEDQAIEGSDRIIANEFE